MISVLRDSRDCVGFLRSAGPRAFRLTTAPANFLFEDRQATIEAITDLNSIGD
jgi:hypothetical protein